MTKTTLVLASLTTVGLTLSANMQHARAAPYGPVCRGQYKTGQDCLNADDFAQRIPVGANHCGSTCADHQSVSIGCDDIKGDAQHYCTFIHKKNPNPLVWSAFPPAAGNQCGYTWFFIDCEKTARPQPPGPPQTAFDTEGGARARCKTEKVVWVNTKGKTHTYHYAGSRWYGTTPQGTYMCESDARTSGYKPSNSS
jgi:hypothetical protein